MLLVCNEFLRDGIAARVSGLRVQGLWGLMGFGFRGLGFMGFYGFMVNGV